MCTLDEKAELKKDLEGEPSEHGYPETKPSQTTSKFLISESILNSCHGHMQQITQN